MKGLIVCCLLILGFGLKAQDHLLLRGQTRDTTLAPIAFANVMAIDTATKEMKAFAVTDVKGNFQLRLEKNTAYELQVTFVGFTPIKQLVTLEQSPEDPLIIIMKESVNALDEVTVVSEMPVLVRGDTISYKAEAFTKGDERKLEDVLAELPGFDVNDNGEIEVQGKRVDKVLVDGKEFFEGDTKLATQNIPADVVDRVQVLQNFNDIAPMQGVMDDDRLALNIELKGDKKRMVFGDIEVGGGPEKRYFGHANTFYYAPQTSVNFIGNTNNVGELALSLSDYFRMSGGMAALASRNGTSYRINAGDAGIPLTDRNSAQNLTNSLGALNVTTRFSDKVQFSGFAIGFDNNVEMATNSQRTYPQLSGQTQELLNTVSTIDNRSVLGRFSAKYTPSYNLQIDYNFFGKRSTIDQFMLLNSQLLSGSNQLSEGNERMPSSQNHQARLFSAIDDKNIISAEVSYNTEENLTEQLLVSEQALFGSFLTSNAPILQLSQDQKIDSKRLDGAFNYYHILNKTTHLNVAFGINLSRQSLTNLLLSESDQVEQAEQKLDITNRYARFLYKKRWNRLTLIPEVSINSYSVSTLGESSDPKQYVFPQVNALYEFGSSHEIEINYQQSIEYNDVGAYADNYRLDRYNTLLVGNPALNPAIYHSINVSYRNFNMYNFFNIYGGLNYQYIKEGFTNNQSLVGVENALTAINSISANRIVNGFLDIEKRFDYFRLNGRINLSQTQLNNQFESQAIENNNFIQNYALDMSAKIFKCLTLRTGYSVNVNRYSSGDLASTFVNYRPTVSSTLSIKGWRLETEYAYNKYVNQSQNQQSAFDVLDVSVSYRKAKSPWEFKVQGLNLLDTREVRRDSFSNNLISTFSYGIQQRYGLFTIKYDI
ncbi:MAG: carboxypeptidase-like regulatory domain-containing protein [Ekhidna sp.]